jgi:poly-gamma-glutamate synthesis protein (capsule biosynthesis protein)
MGSNTFLHKLTLLAGVGMISAGIGLAIWAVVHFPPQAGREPSALAAADSVRQSPLAAASPLTTPTQAQPTPAVAAGAVVTAPPKTGPTIYPAVHLPHDLQAGLETLAAAGSLTLVEPGADTATADTATADTALRLDWTETQGEPLFRQYFAAATRFDTIDLNLRRLHLERAWQGDTRTFTQIAVLTDTLPALTQLFGPPGNSVVGWATMDEVTAAAWQDRTTLALVPFDQLVPELAVYSVEGQTPVENLAKFNPAAYPLVATIYAHADATAITPAEWERLVDSLPASNRDPNRLTVVAMTGVTAMVRLTAAAMDERGNAWPADVVGPELAAADITAISNEVPFVPDCETDTSEDNLVFCSKPEYMATLRASGTDIIGLTGNHQNDYGLTNALTSLEIYAAEGLPVYGGGVDKAAAFAPLYIEHNGNRLAFLGANSYGPPSAWAGDFSPGSAPFDLAIMSAAIRSIKASGDADLVFAELQYQESYAVTPLYDQRLDFGALARAGADVVTGVQSHVPQAVEFVDNHLVLYGLGNLYFDQMWTEETREGLIVKHTLYNGRHLSTQLLPTLLFDYGQPRWPDPERRAAILAKVFGASQWQ